MKLSGFPRIRLANLPTPLQELPNLSKVLNGPKIFVKRDDMTGLAFGGNKTRKLEYLMADALRNKANYIVTGAGFHSNWCTQATAAARRLGMKITLIKEGPKEGYDPGDYDGNHLLHFLQGAEIKVTRPEKRREIADWYFEIYERVESRIDTNWDPNERLTHPYFSMSRKLHSSLKKPDPCPMNFIPSPEHIEDPDLRARYEKALNEHNTRAEYLGEQNYLRRFHKDWSFFYRNRSDSLCGRLRLFIAPLSEGRLYHNHNRWILLFEYARMIPPSTIISFWNGNKTRSCRFLWSGAETAYSYKPSSTPHYFYNPE